MKIIEGLLFQQKRGANIFQKSLNVTTIPTASRAELQEICRRIWGNKVQDVDEIPNRALNFAELFEARMSEGSANFQGSGKRWYSYLRLTNLHTMGKMLERVTYNNLLLVVKS